MIKFFYSLLIGGSYLLGLLLFLFSSYLGYWGTLIIILGAAYIFFYFKFYK